jgi:Pentapeptide repeats (8 copies)
VTPTRRVPRMTPHPSGRPVRAIRPRQRAKPAASSALRRGINWPAITSTITAATAVGALIFTALSLNATRDQIALTEQGQFTDRYVKAVEQLDRSGPNHLQARLGAIYALERLTHDSPRDQPTIVEVLSGFVRTNTPSLSVYPTCPDAPAKFDVQVALTVIGRRDESFDNGAAVDLHQTCLTSYNLSDANLSNAILYGADLSNIMAHRADLSRANLITVKLDGSDFSDANLVSADLTNASCENTVFFRGNLRNGNFTGVNLSADLFGADLSDADLRGADLTHSVYDKFTRVSNAKVDRGTKGVWW